MHTTGNAVLLYDRVPFTHQEVGVIGGGNEYLVPFVGKLDSVSHSTEEVLFL